MWPVQVGPRFEMRNFSGADIAEYFMVSKHT